MKAYLGIDGGGTQTRSLLVNDAGEILSQATTGPTNPQHIDHAELVPRLQGLLDQTFAQVDRRITECHGCAGLSGASFTKTRRRLEDALEQLNPQPVGGFMLRTDADIALTGALLDAPGVVLIAGTGSVCFGRDGEGNIHRTGGWGYLIDDAGSGGWIGRRALECAVRQADGRIPRTALLEAVVAHFDVRSIEALIPRLHDGSIPNREIAQLSHCVLELADADDRQASGIIHAAVIALSELVRVTLSKTALQNAPVVLSGGLVESRTALRERLERSVRAGDSSILFTGPILQPVAGAVVESFGADATAAKADFISRLMRSFA